MQKFAFIFTFVFLMLCPAPAYSATLESLEASGVENVVKDKDVIDSYIASLPQGVVDLYNARGGEIVFLRPEAFLPAQGLIISNTSDHPGGPLVGLYYHESKKIKIRPSEGAYTTANTISHEIGHFLFQETYPSWPQETKDTVQKYWDNADQLSYGNADEYFAVNYALFTENPELVVPELAACFENINHVAARLLERSRG